MTSVLLCSLSCSSIGTGQFHISVNFTLFQLFLRSECIIFFFSDWSSCHAFANQILCLPSLLRFVKMLLLYLLLRHFGSVLHGVLGGGLAWAKIATGLSTSPSLLPPIYKHSTENFKLTISYHHFKQSKKSYVEGMVIHLNYQTFLTVKGPSTLPPALSYQPCMRFMQNFPNLWRILVSMLEDLHSFTTAICPIEKKKINFIFSKPFVMIFKAAVC